MLINLVLAIFALKTHALTLKSAIIAYILGVLVLLSSWKAYIFLFVYFVSITVLEKLLFKNKNEIRGSIQVISNFIFAFIALALYHIFKDDSFFVLYCSMLSVSMCDTVASAVGTKFAKNVFSITTFRSVKTGCSGGVSIIGTLAALFFGILFGLVYLLLNGFDNLSGFLYISVSGFLGMIIDSFLGDRFQKKYKCGVCGCLVDKKICCASQCIQVSGFLSNTQVNILSEAIVFCVLMLIFKW